jgi:FtsH-binding integral membrane protein
MAILPLVAFGFLGLAVSRYREDRRALVGGIVAAIGGTIGVSLVLRAFSMPAFVALVCVGFVLAVAGSVYAERRLHRVQQPGR